MSPHPSGPAPTGRAHLAAVVPALAALERDLDRIDRWGRHLARVLLAGGRLLAAGNGGSAAEAQHLTAELVGRYRDERRPLSALALHAETSSLTAICNDYGAEEGFARQVRAHGRAGDVLLLLSTSGRSRNVLAAARAARDVGMTVWGLTGRTPNPLVCACDEAVAVDAAATATVQEVQLVVVHLLCAAVDAVVLGGDASGAPVRAPAPQRQARRAGRRLVVVGDVLLDRDLDGSVERLAPDAPVPVVDSPEGRARPGGAGLAAVLAAATVDGVARPVTLVTALGDDDPGREVAALLAAAGVEVVDLGLGGATPQKVRVRAGGRPLLRLDYGGAAGHPGPLTDAGRAALADAGAVLVSDYGRGITAEPSVRAALEALAGRTPVVWDPHPRGAPPVPGTRLVTPNRDEAARFAAGLSDAPTGDTLAAVTARAGALRRAWRSSGVVVTLGAGGALLVGADGTPLAVPAPPVAAGDPCGAGDRFAARAAERLADGALPSEAVADAVAAAAAFVARGGAGTVGVVDASAGAGDAVAGGVPGDALAVATRTRAAGGTVVATGGCFDLLHAGHVRTLEAARALGDCLVVCLNSDASVRRLKGPGRPVVPEADRAAVLAGLGCVDAVAVFDEDTPEAVLQRLRPDVWAKGADYAVADLPEARVLARWGGQAVVLPYLAGRSTTRLIQEVTIREH